MDAYDELDGLKCDTPPMDVSPRIAVRAWDRGECWVEFVVKAMNPDSEADCIHKTYAFGAEQSDISMGNLIRCLCSQGCHTNAQPAGGTTHLDVVRGRQRLC